MASSHLRVRLLGEFDLRSGDVPLPPLESARAQSLLAYLLLHQETPQSRQRLAFLLWPDSTESQARTNLRHLLHTLRRAFPESDRFLEITPRTLHWRSDAPCWLDVAAFTAVVSGTEEDGADGDLAALREAVALYAGDLLEGCYDEWILEERERLRECYLTALERLAARLEQRGDPAQAVQYAERLLRHDPLREETYRRLMRLHDACGDRARALRTYHVCATTLERELGVAPSAPTLAAYEALLPPDPHPAGPDPDPPRHDVRLSAPTFVGRGPERARLASLWQATEGGQPQFVLVSGEPGIGKTRLVEEFRAWCVHRGAVAAEARSYPAEGTLAYAPAVAWLRSEGLKSRIGRLDRARQSELARLIPELLTTAPGLTRPEPLPDDDQRQRLFDAIAAAILAPGAPLLLVADDLHWCDRETLRFLHYLLRVQPRAPLLVAATARREEIDCWHPLHDLVTGLHALDRCTEIPLERLTRAEAGLLAGRIVGHPIAEPDADRLYSETEGNPLFVVEVLRAGWARGGAVEVQHGWVSPKVQAAIEARLTQLSEPARELAGLAAAIGRAFTADVLAGASEAGEDAVVRGLDELWRRGIVREQQGDGYDFSHGKIREVAYLGLSPAQRRHHHRRIAQALERRHAHDAGPVSGQLAAHYEQAGLTDQAVAWYERAADAAQQLHANVEAIRLLERALVLLRARPPTPERHTRELDVLAALPAPLGWVDGWGSERLVEVQRRAHELARELGVELAPPLLRSLAIASLSRRDRDFAAARGFGERLRALGERDDDDVLLVEADYVLGIAAFWQGEFAAARAHFEAVVDRYQPAHRRAHLLRYGLDPKVVCLSRLGNTLWFLGYPAAATRARDAALALAAEIGHPFSRATALIFAAMLALDVRDPDGIRVYATMLATEQAERETRLNQVNAEAIGGYVDVLDGRVEPGLARIQGTLDALQARPADHAPGMRAVIVRVLLETCALAGAARTGLAATDRALASGEAARPWEAETHRLRAEFLAMLGAPAQDVEAEVERALAVARKQGAAMLELRAAMSLLRARLTRLDPRSVQARETLAAIVAGLPEARDGQDRREAVALLSQN